MLALIVVCIVMVLLLGLLVIGLLRSHADILRALHTLGAGVGELTPGHTSTGIDAETSAAPVDLTRLDAGSPLVVGPRLPTERRSSSASDVVGTGPDGEVVSIAAIGIEHQTLFAFLTTGCMSCAGFWEALEDPWRLGLADSVRPVIVTKGAELESPAAVRRRVTSVPVVMSTEAWADYEVPGAPFFALVDGPSSRRVGEGTARDFAQILSMVERAMTESLPAAGAPAGAPDRTASSGGRFRFDGADREREARNDRELLAAGITPGHPSLHPSGHGRSRGAEAASAPAGEQPLER